LFALDRREYDLGATLHFAVGALDPETGTFTLPAGWTADIAFRLKPCRDDANGPVAEVPLRLDFPATPGPQRYTVAIANAHAVPISALRREDGRPAGIRPGDRLIIQARLANGGHLHDIENQITYDMENEITVVGEPVIGPPDAVYSLIDVTVPGKRLSAARASTALHAAAPMPQRIEFPDLVGDLGRGHVRRCALFIWRHTEVGAAAPTRYSTLIKIDRSGGGQLPRLPDDFYPRLGSS
jgi:hypothetical protein